MSDKLQIIYKDPRELKPYANNARINDKVVAAINEAVKLYQPAFIVTAGEPRGVCEDARLYARQHAIPLTLFFADRARCQGKYDWRSYAVYNNCDHVLLIHDGQSKGTQNEYDQAKKMGIGNTYVLIEQDEIDKLLISVLDDKESSDIAELLGE